MVYLATVKAAGPHKDMQVVVKCIDRDFLPREDKEDILEEVKKAAHFTEWRAASWENE